MESRHTNGLQGHQQSAQGIALGMGSADDVRPVRAKALPYKYAFALSGRFSRTYPQTQGAALGCHLIALSGHTDTFPLTGRRATACPYNHKGKLKLKILVAFLVLLFASGLHAQEVQSFRQHDMKRWGIPAGNYSGIAHIDGDRYALVSDKQEADGWTEVSISFLPSGDIDRMTFIAHHYDASSQGKARDSEGIAYVPGQGFFVCAENDQQILELTEGGSPTSRRLSVPTHFGTSNIFPNYGFEALTYDAGQRLFWTTTEQGLKSDVATLTTHETPSPTLLRLQSFGSDLQPRQQFAYMTEAPTTRRIPRHFAFGVPELLALNDTTLIVMERELSIPKRYNRARCNIRLFCVNPSADGAINDSALPLREMEKEAFLTKKPLYAFSTGIRIAGRKNLANYEGMCLGPRLADGRQTLLLIADSQGRAGKALFHLKDYIKVIAIR